MPETPDRRGELSAELGRRGRPRSSRLVPLGRDPAWPRCGGRPDPVAFGLAPSPASGPNARSLAIGHRCGPPAEPETNYADAAVPGRRLDGVSIPLRVPGAQRSPSGGRAIALSSRAGGTERFLGRRPVRQSAAAEVTAGGPRRAVWHRLGRDSPLSLARAEMPPREPSRCGRVMPAGTPAVCECE